MRISGIAAAPAVVFAAATAVAEPAWNTFVSDAFRASIQSPVELQNRSPEANNVGMWTAETTEPRANYLFSAADFQADPDRTYSNEDLLKIIYHGLMTDGRVLKDEAISVTGGQGREGIYERDGWRTRVRAVVKTPRFAIAYVSAPADKVEILDDPATGRFLSSLSLQD